MVHNVGMRQSIGPLFAFAVETGGSGPGLPEGHAKEKYRNGHHAALGYGSAGVVGGAVRLAKRHEGLMPVLTKTVAQE